MNYENRPSSLSNNTLLEVQMLSSSTVSDVRTDYGYRLIDTSSTDLAEAALNVATSLPHAIVPAMLERATRIILNCLDDDVLIDSHQHLLCLSEDRLLWWTLQRISEAAVRAGYSRQRCLASAIPLLLAYLENAWGV